MTTPNAAKAAATAKAAAAAAAKAAAAVSLAHGLAIAALVVSILSLLGHLVAWSKRIDDVKRIENVKGEVNKELEKFKGDIRLAEAKHVEKLKGDIRRDVEENLKTHESRLRLESEMQLRMHDKSWDLLRQTVEVAFETQLAIGSIANAKGGPLDGWNERMSALKALVGSAVVAPPDYDLMGLLKPFFDTDPRKFLTDEAEVEKATKSIAQVIAACGRWNKDLWAATAQLEGVSDKLDAHRST